MRFFKSLPKRRKTRDRVVPPSAAGNRRQSKDAAFAPEFDLTLCAKRPSLTMFPHDSAASISQLSQSAPVQRRLPTNRSYQGKRPTLQDILANTSQEPWTLAAFTRYCEQNLCLENLRFIQTAEQYKQDYAAWLENTQTEIILDVDPLATQLLEQWKLLLAHFIATGGPQEVNLTGDVRDALLAVVTTTSPADPELLAPALRLTQRLIEDSILFPFLSEKRPPPAIDDFEEVIHIEQTHGKGIAIQTITHESRPSSRENNHKPPRSSTLSHHNSTSMRSPPSSATSTHRNSRPKSLFSTLEHSQSSGNTSLDVAIIDDSTTSITSPTPTNSTSRTPPMSPPPSERDRPNSRLRSDSKWRLLGAKLGFKGRGSEGRLQSPKPGFRKDGNDSP